jgi:hypothetical protein
MVERDSSVESPWLEGRLATTGGFSSSPAIVGGATGPETPCAVCDDRERLAEAAHNYYLW